MPDELIRKFFEGELTEAEKDRLGTVLESSDEEAGHFADLAEEAYRATGFPAPRPPSGLAFLGKTLAVVFLALLAFHTIRHCQEACDLKKARMQSLPPVTVVPKTSVPTVKPKAARSSMKEEKTLTAPELQEVQMVPVLKVKLTTPTNLAVDVFAQDGTHVRHLAEGAYPAGDHRFEWDGTDSQGRTVARGMYRMRVQDGRQATDTWVLPPGLPSQ